MIKKARRPRGVQMRSLRMPTIGWAINPKRGFTARIIPMIPAFVVNFSIVWGRTLPDMFSVMIRPDQIEQNTSNRPRGAFFAVAGFSSL